MAKLRIYVFISLNGFYKGVNEDISWAIPGEKEEEKFIEENFNGKSILLFGRKTYELMKDYWPTPQAIAESPVIAKGMNEAEKIVFSRTLKEPGWDNVRVVRDNIEEAIKELKQGSRNMTIMGSSNLASQLADSSLIDEYQVMVHPIVLEEGTPFLSGIEQKLELELINTRSFENGVVLLTYRPSKKKV